MPALKNARHERFCQEVANGASSADAYIAAGFKTNAGNARRLKLDEAIRERIEAILNDREHIHADAIKQAIEETGISIGAVLKELAKIGFANIADYVDVSGESPTIVLTDVPRDKLAALSEITTETVFEKTGSGAPNEVRRVKIKLWDKRASLVDIGKHLGMFRDKVELTGANGEPLPAERTVIILPSNARD